MVVYSIKDIEEITGIKAHTLRIWEKRYDIIVPKRTETNIRYYTEADLKDILNISLLNKHGFKISNIAKMDRPAIQQQIAILTKTEDKLEEQLDALTLAVINLDEKSINRIIDNYIKQLGLEETMEILVNPFLEKLSLFWISGSVKAVHESFISEILKQKTIRAIQDCEVVEINNAPSFILFLLEGEKQELSILFLKYLLKKKGIQAKIIGFDLSIKDVLDAYFITKSDYLYTIINEERNDQNLLTYINYLSKNIEGSKFLISGYKAINLSNELPENCISHDNLDDAIKFIEKLVLD